MGVSGLSASSLKQKLLSGEVTAQEIVAATYRRIAETDGEINAFITLTEERATRQAQRVDERLRRGEPVGSLAGIPVAVKDNMCMEGVLTTCGSRILSNFVAPYDATVVRRLIEADAVIIGKTNMDEFAMGSSNENSYFGPVKNPHDHERIPGGSSGGSAAAVASGQAILALGSDTGGSVRQPAALCGVVGLKPTYGRVSRYGLVAYASSLDQIGPIAKTVEDCAMVLRVIAGHDPRDSTSVKAEVPSYSEALGGRLKGIRIGLPEEYFAEGLDPEVESAIRDAVEPLTDSGVSIESVSLPHTDYAVAAYYILATAEASSNLARYDGVRYGYRSPGDRGLIDLYIRSRSEGFGQEVQRRIMLGTYALSAGYYDAYYLKAQKVRTLIKEDFDRAFLTYDVLITPTSPTPAFKFGEKLDDPLTMYLSDIYTISANLAGLPAVSIPCGKTQSGLPIGLQITGKPFDEATVLKIAAAIER
ncbi:MAG: Asp-tRNA(Asn)/Glu-tRNA(Gln) amidotransferase subunit GatA [bacterium]